MCLSTVQKFGKIDINPKKNNVQILSENIDNLINQIRYIKAWQPEAVE